MEAADVTTELRDWLEQKDSNSMAMEVDQPSLPQSSIEALASVPPNESAGAGGIGGGARDIPLPDSPSRNSIFKLDEFIAAYEVQHLANQRALRAQSQAPSKRPKNQNGQNGQNSQNLRTFPQAVQSTKPSTPTAPISLGSRSSASIIALNYKYQTLGIVQPHFTFSGRSDLGWTISVSFPGLESFSGLQNVPAQGPFNSKSEAKEAMSKTCLDLLCGLEEEGKLGTRAERKTSLASTVSETASNQQEENKKEKEVQENYIGQLLEFQRARSGAQPVYTDYASGSRFACLLNIDGVDRSFGALEKLFGNKKAARQDAAGAAVQYFKNSGEWPETFTPLGGIRKRKVSAICTSAPTSLTPNTIDTSLDTSSPTQFSSHAAHLAHLSNSLSLGTPAYTYTPHPGAPDFHTVSVSFPQAARIPLLPGVPPHGEIATAHTIFGKKKAKEECARLGVAVLESLKQRRMEAAMAGGMGGAVRAMSGARGMQELSREQVLKATTGEREARTHYGVGSGGAGAGAVGEVRVKVEDENEDVFEDAREQF